jgi:uncharacterized iron-regulated protein
MGFSLRRIALGWGRWTGLIALTFLACACAGSGLRLAGRGLDLKPDQIVDLKSRAPVGYDQMVADLVQARVIFIGELHTHAAQHEHQLKIIKSLWQANPKLTIGLELFERDRQGFLDRWMAGDIPEDDFKREILQNDFNHATLDVYYPLLAWAREKKVPLMALNAPRTITSQIAKFGPGSLEDQQRGRIAAEIEPGPPEYQTRVLAAFGHHQVATDPDNFFFAQVTWDETMAESLASYLTSPAGAGRQVVVIAGNQHVYHGYGVPGRLMRRLPVSQRLLLMMVSTENETLGPKAGDYVWITAPEQQKERARLGIGLERSEGGLVVTKVLEGSEAERVGLAVGDRILTMDGAAVTSPMDLHQAAVGDVSEGLHLLTVDRRGQVLEFRIKFGDVKTPQP